MEETSNVESKIFLSVFKGSRTAIEGLSGRGRVKALCHHFGGR